MQNVVVFNPGTRMRLGVIDGGDFEFRQRQGSIGGVGRSQLVDLIGQAMARQFDLQFNGVLLESCRLVRKATRFEFVYSRESAAPHGGSAS